LTFILSFDCRTTPEAGKSIEFLSYRPLNVVTQLLSFSYTIVNENQSNHVK